MDLLKSCHRQGSDAEGLADSILDLLDQGVGLRTFETTSKSIFAGVTKYDFPGKCEEFLDNVLEDEHEHAEDLLHDTLPWYLRDEKPGHLHEKQGKRKRRKPAKPHDADAKPAEPAKFATPPAHIAKQIEERKLERSSKDHLCHVISSTFCAKTGEHLKVDMHAHTHVNCPRPHVYTTN